VHVLFVFAVLPVADDDHARRPHSCVRPAARRNGGAAEPTSVFGRCERAGTRVRSRVRARDGFHQRVDVSIAGRKSRVAQPSGNERSSSALAAVAVVRGGWIGTRRGIVPVGRARPCDARPFGGRHRSVVFSRNGDRQRLTTVEATHIATSCRRNSSPSIPRNGAMAAG
jgi:hypothetical protein